MDNTCMEDLETIHEFLVESDENLTRLDQDLVELEKHPRDALLLGSVFRTIHTIKGACGFLAFTTLEGITHQAESILSQLGDGERELTPDLVALILETVDATRKVLASTEESGKEGPLRLEALIERLCIAAQLPSRDEQQPPSVEALVSATLDSTADESSEKRSFALPGDQRPESAKSEEEAARGEEGKEEEVIRHSSAVDSNILVGVGLLDKLMDLVGGLGRRRLDCLRRTMKGKPMRAEVRKEMLVRTVGSVFVTMLGLDVSQSEIPSRPAGDRLTSYVQLSGDWNGAVLLECTRRQACHFAGLILATDPPKVVDDDVRDVLGELANVIGGNMKCGMSPATRLSMPTVIEGGDDDLRIFGSKARERLTFQSSEGHFWVTILIAS